MILELTLGTVLVLAGAIGLCVGFKKRPAVFASQMGIFLGVVWLLLNAAVGLLQGSF